MQNESVRRELLSIAEAYEGLVESVEVIARAATLS